MQTTIITEFLNRDKLPPITQIEIKNQTSKERINAKVITEFLNRGELPPIVKSETNFIGPKTKIRARKIR